ncbi:MAG: disulfide bond formation protein B [Sutterellaceae bacterium]|nr:disulfide bond formation protein B [Burkholderiaceae bacterium]MDW8429406.1 disulfide bond formation protein B [Sutterellaceae bacterium]
MNGLSSRTLLVAAAAWVAAVFAAALYLQHVVGLAPCPLCVLQRVGMLAGGLLAAAAAAARTGSWTRIAVIGTALVATAAGGGVAIWHSWLLANPPEQLGCGRPFQWFHEDFPLAVWLPRLFRGDGDCLRVEWSLLGLTVPHWSLLGFAALLALLGLALRQAWRERAARASH